jgi:hypothetical protein
MTFGKCFKTLFMCGYLKKKILPYIPANMVVLVV